MKEVKQDWIQDPRFEGTTNGYYDLKGIVNRVVGQTVRMDKL